MLPLTAFLICSPGSGELPVKHTTDKGSSQSYWTQSLILAQAAQPPKSSDTPPPPLTILYRRGPTGPGAATQGPSITYECAQQKQCQAEPSFPSRTPTSLSVERRSEPDHPSQHSVGLLQAWTPRPHSSPPRAATEGEGPTAESEKGAGPGDERQAPARADSPKGMADPEGLHQQ